MPPVRVGLEFLSIPGKDLRGVESGIYGEGNEADLFLKKIRTVKRGQMTGHDGTRPGAGGKDEIRDPDFALLILTGECLAPAVREREV